MNIITGYRGEPHITSSQDGAKNQGMYGTGSYIMNVGQKLQAQVVSANEIRIRDGVLSHQGCIAVIENGAYDSLEISNGTQGMQRRDLIVARYTKDAETNIEDISLVVIEGTPAASNPSDPAYNHGDIQAGDSPVDFPLYRVNISGVTVSGTTRLASYVQTQAEADAAINTLNSKINRSTLSNTAISASNLEIPITNYAQYAFFVMEVSAQLWVDTYIWSTYAATKNVQFGYNHGSSAKCDFSASGFNFSNLSLASGISSFNVRVIGVKIPTV